MPPRLLIDALYHIAQASGQWRGDAELLHKLVTAEVGEDVLQRTPSDVCRLLNAKEVKAALAERGVTITVHNGFITLVAGKELENAK